LNKVMATSSHSSVVEQPGRLEKASDRFRKRLDLERLVYFRDDDGECREWEAEVLPQKVIFTTIRRISAAGPQAGSLREKHTSVRELVFEDDQAWMSTARDEFTYQEIAPGEWKEVNRTHGGILCGSDPEPIEEENGVFLMGERRFHFSREACEPSLLAKGC
jgi:hypothetical protein